MQYLRSSLCHHHWYSTGYSRCILQHRLRVISNISVVSSVDLPGTNQACFHTTANLNAQEKEERKIYSLWSSFARGVQLLTTGVKALYKDIKQIQDYRTNRGRKLVIGGAAPQLIEGGKTDMLYSREEVQFIYRVCVYVFIN